MKTVKFIPNLLTLLNLLCGCLAVIFAINYQIEYTVALVMLGIFFDFFDGFAARLLKVQSELGKQLDSLADMVTSGVVPGLVMVQMILKSLDQKPLIGIHNLDQFSILAMLGLSITMASCYRLANFNIDENQKEGFIGLPTPANTLLILSLPLMQVYSDYQYVSYIVDNTYALLLLTALSCYLLNARIALFALKFKSFGYKDNKIKYIFLCISLALIIAIKLASIPAIILVYLLLSLITNNNK
ncbi:CDP-alcohol phosphatidyltransferase family protein [Wenyingzhuangia sp. IMCC45533]